MESSKAKLPFKLTIKTLLISALILTGIQHVAQTAFVRNNLSTLYLQPEKKATK